MLIRENYICFYIEFPRAPLQVNGLFPEEIIQLLQKLQKNPLHSSEGAFVLPQIKQIHTGSFLSPYFPTIA